MGEGGPLECLVFPFGSVFFEFGGRICLHLFANAVQVVMSFLFADFVNELTFRGTIWVRV